jgi:hypothetical protein
MEWTTGHAYAYVNVNETQRQFISYEYSPGKLHVRTVEQLSAAESEEGNVGV